MYGSRANLENTFGAIANGERSMAGQGWAQIIALFVTLGISLFSGALAGFLTSRCCNTPYFFDDTQHFHECEPPQDEHKAKEMHDVVPDTDRPSIAVDGKVQ